MRRKHIVALACGLVACVALSTPARSQDPGLQAYYWPHRTVGIPVDVDRIAKLPNKPTDLQLYYWVNGGQLQKGSKLPLTAMQQLDGGKRGFLFTAERDGDFEFTVQFVYSDSTTSPRTDELAPQQRIVLDTLPPLVKVYPSATGVEWVATDDNIDGRGTQLQCKWPTGKEWTTVTEREFRSADRYAWKLPPGRVLEVRVLARDKAGNEGVSQIVRVPPDATMGVGNPKPPGPEWTDRNLPQTRIDYVNTLDFDVDYTVQKMGRSGIRAAHLFVQKGSSNWELVKRFEVTLKPGGDKDSSLTLPYKAKDEGIYGFYVIAESGAGRKADDPRKDDPPMVNVVVDKTAPYVRISGVQVRKGGSRGPLVEITWEAADPNLMPQPISLEWSLDATAAKWNEVKYRLDNNLSKTSGRYTWEVPDENLWKFYIRARAVDKASNTGEHIYGQKDADGKEKPTEVIIDLETPSATINKVRGGNTPKLPSGGGGGGSDTPPKKGGSGNPLIPTLPDDPSN